ncbi:MAG TPA: CopD family protein [Thermoanaerobaculia bacterium]|nr:CopD family protein [Thermoanaerobaculia bacterium]
MDAAALWIEAAGRWAVYLTALPWLGAVSARLLLWPRVTVTTPDERLELDRALGRLALLLAMALLFALALRALGQTAIAFGLGDALDLDHLRTVVVESRWGGRFRWQAYAACAVLVASLLVRLRIPGGWALATLAGVALCVALPRTGHAVSQGTLALAAQALHVLGGGLWVGTLAVVVGRRLWGAREERQWGEGEGGDRGKHALTAEALRVFAPVAITGASALAVSGLLTSYLYLPDLASLFTTSWGRALLLKTALVGVVGLLGLLNFRRFRRANTAVASLRLPRIELLVALVVVLLTGLLTALPSPSG